MTKAGITLSQLEQWEQHVKENYLDTGLLPNALTLVYHRGEIVHQQAQGWADIERQIPLREDHIFRIYSMTKPITSVALMMLVEQGKLTLNDPVSAYIPAWEGLQVYTGGQAGDFQTQAAGRPMQIVDLLRHTAGLSYFIQQGSPVDAAYRSLGLGTKTTLEDFITQLGTLPLQFQPGEVWHYSAATDVLGYLVGKISGQAFEQFVRDNILTPLEMRDTDFLVPPEKAERLVACYALTPGGRVLADDPKTSPYLAAPRFVSGGGGLVGTAADYLRFCRMLLRGGELDGARLIGPKTLELMTMNHLPGGQDIAALSRSPIAVSETTSAGVGFGLGFAVTLDPARTLTPGNTGDFYWGGAAGTYFWVDPKEDLAVIFMTQTLFYPERPRRILRTMVYSALAEKLHATKA